MSIFDMPDHSMDGLDVKKLTTQFDAPIIGLIGNLLKDNGIVYMLRDSTNMGGLSRIVYSGGYARAGMDFFVKSEDHERAKGLLDAYVNGGGAIAESEGE